MKLAVTVAFIGALLVLWPIVVLVVLAVWKVTS